MTILLEVVSPTPLFVQCSSFVQLPKSMANTVPFGGYDCEFVEPPPSAFQVDCAICLLKLRDPQQVSCCGKNFCDPCLKRLQLWGQQCPTCKLPFIKFSNKGLKQSLTQLHVYCTHHGDGCEWKGELGQLDQHLNENSAPGGDGDGCPFAEVKCIHCSKKFQRRRHPFESCPKRQVNCHYYNQGCRWKGELAELEQHMNKECIHAVVNCTFNYAGCEVQLPSKDMPAHMAESVGTHLQLLGAQNQKLGALIERLKVMMIWLVIIVSAVIIVLAVIIVFATHATESNVTPLQGQCHTIESNSSTSIPGQCHAMVSNITALERQYRSIEAKITSLQQQYRTIKKEFITRPPVQDNITHKGFFLGDFITPL